MKCISVYKICKRTHTITQRFQVNDNHNIYKQFKFERYLKIKLTSNVIAAFRMTISLTTHVLFETKPVYYLCN